MEKLGKIIHPKDAKVFMDEQELVREYLHTDKITFGVSRLKPGAVGGLYSAIFPRMTPIMSWSRAMRC